MTMAGLVKVKRQWVVGGLARVILLGNVKVELLFLFTTVNSEL